MKHTNPLIGIAAVHPNKYRQRAPEEFARTNKRRSHTSRLTPSNSQNRTPSRDVESAGILSRRTFTGDTRNADCGMRSGKAEDRNDDL
jgi:hypothetical protein